MFPSEKYLYLFTIYLLGSYFKAVYLRDWVVKNNNNDKSYFEYLYIPKVGWGMP